MVFFFSIFINVYFVYCVFVCVYYILDAQHFSISLPLYIIDILKSFVVKKKLYLCVCVCLYHFHIVLNLNKKININDQTIIRINKNKNKILSTNIFCLNYFLNFKF